MNVLIIVLGLLPFAFGGSMNWYMLSMQYAMPPFAFFVITLLVLLAWGAIAFWGRRKLGTEQVVIGLNLIAFVVLLLLAIQELILHSYWLNSAGIWTQLFYLPLMNVSSLLTTWSHSTFTTHCAAFILLIASSVLGCNAAEANPVSQAGPSL